MSDLTILPRVEIGFFTGSRGSRGDIPFFGGGVNTGAGGFLPEGWFSKVG